MTGCLTRTLNSNSNYYSVADAAEHLSVSSSSCKTFDYSADTEYEIVADVDFDFDYYQRRLELRIDSPVD